ncbi:substrate-binding periplasmic protein [Colwellia psychrerythraea]|uniref:ABC-type transporter, periplasmic subunit family 3 n=1 Tax=Colwellia psychrerythraea TaxID=28229 RepID=A0A099KPX8_COLPS|nr:transporter substrate-binding domain-containing protein [Colwellia psychrerythraea]KGJ91668.1 ABC-type transporter, periplasmic subunit family 3 [Colwellia psychrerythraea]
MKYFSSIICVFLLLISHSCFSENTENVLQMRTIAVAPYGINTNGELSGIYYDLANKLLVKADIESEHHIFPYGRIMHELKLGKTDLTIMFKYKELADYVDYIYPLPTLKNVVIGRKDTNFSSVKQLEKLSIAYLRGAKFSDDIDNNPEIIKQTVSDFYQGLLMLKKGRVDAIIGPMAPIISAAKNLDLSRDFFGKPLIVSERTPWLQLSKKSHHKVSAKQLKNIFSQMMAQGELNNIQQKYQ